MTPVTVTDMSLDRGLDPWLRSKWYFEPLRLVMLSRSELTRSRSIEPTVPLRRLAELVKTTLPGLANDFESALDDLEIM